MCIRDSVITADVIRHTSVDEQVTQPLEHILAGELLGDIDRQSLPSELVHEESSFE